MDLVKLKKVCDLYKEKTAKSCYAINFTGEEPAITDDKLGGKPYLPVGEKYPTDSKNRPLPLLFQVNLKNIELENFPKEGILEIFTNIDSPCDFCIKIFLEGKEYQKEFPETKCFYLYNKEEHEADYFITNPTKITFEKTICHKPFSNFDADDTLLEIVEEVYGKVFANFDEMWDYFQEEQFWEEKGLNILKEEYGIVLEEDNNDNSEKAPQTNGFIYDEEKLLQNCRNKDFWDFEGLIYEQLNIPKSCIGGYADFTQKDPRYIGDNKTECLFKIDSCGNEDFIEIVDSGIIFGLISTEDLKNQNFEKCLVDYDFC